MTSPLRLEEYLAPADAERVHDVLKKLSNCDLDYAVTGGLASELGLGSSLGRQRMLNDIDIVVPDYDALPATLGTAFLVSHAHPHRPKGKLALQLIDTVQRLRIDLFSACGATLARARPAQISDLPIKVLCLEDMACRIASEMMGFCQGNTISPKSADDHLRTVQAAHPRLIEDAWQEQRRGSDPATYAEASILIAKALEMKRGTFKKVVYSTDLASVCAHCQNTAPFTIAKPKAVFEILGYC